MIASLREHRLAAQLAAIDKVRKGNHWNDPHDAAVHVIAEGLKDLGLIDSALPEAIAVEYDCETRPLPHFQLERNEVNPVRVRAGDEFNHRLVYALCPTRPTDVVAGELTTRIRFKGRSLVVDRIPGFEIKPGRWIVDAFVRLPESAETASRRTAGSGSARY